MFEAFLTPDDCGYEEFNEAFADVILHELADLDFKLGRSKREYYLRLVEVYPAEKMEEPPTLREGGVV